MHSRLRRGLPPAAALSSAQGARFLSIAGWTHRPELLGGACVETPDGSLDLAATGWGAAVSLLRRQWLRRLTAADAKL
eukprot:3539336-Alexandrium_andersonii.AAC.1